MWMGTYPTTPSYVLKTGRLLQDVINEDKERLVGTNVLRKFGADLPFLPKILSIAKALPLQIHPDIDLSTRLHEKDPEKFGDTNHKPEIAVALSKFEAFVGFKPKNDIHNLMQLAPLTKFLPNTGNQHFDDQTLKQICKAMLQADETTVASTQEELGTLSASQLGSNSYILDLLPRLQDQYGKTDNGSLVALICMNFLIFQPGEAIYIPADGIHAYLSGDIVECMARSDNVLNTGFCPRAERDSVQLFTEALTFKQHDRQEPVLPRVASEFSTNGKTTAFKPPMSEFNMLISEMKSGDRETIRPIAGPSIMIAIKGKGQMEADGTKFEIAEGYIFFVGQGVQVDFEAESTLEVYRAYAE